MDDVNVKSNRLHKEIAEKLGVSELSPEQASLIEDICKSVKKKDQVNDSTKAMIHG